MSTNPKGRNMVVAWLTCILLFAGCRNFNNFWGDKNAAGNQNGSGATVPAGAISATSPVAGAYVNNTQVSYTFAQTCSTGSVTWLRTGGTADGTSPHVQALVGGELTAGAHNNITLTNNPTLVSGAIYTVTFNCTDMAANAMTPVANAGVTFDNTVPVISSVTLPATGTTVYHTQVTYTLSENCSSGVVTWTQTGGTADGASPHAQAMAGAELGSGAHTAITLANNPVLVSGAIYTVTVACTDLAGNGAVAVNVTNVTYDNVTPVISGVAPSTGVWVVNTQVSYTLSENCNTASITWTRTGGTADGGSPHVQALSAAEKLAGPHNNITLGSNPVLVSGTVYTLDFACTDAAGNAATTVSSTSVTYDNIAPTISGTAPANNAFVNNTQVSYTLSENCATASITWTRTGGTADGASPHVKALTAGELTSGAHNGITITNNPTLVSGAIYTITFNCTDAAGNVAGVITQTNVTYDNVNIVISAVSPASSVSVNTKQVSYTLSEACSAGSVTWTRTGGTADAGSPRVQALTGTELNAGAHTGIILTNNPALVDGTIYTVQFDCTDFAANAATPVTVTNVTYDVTVPVISGVSPATSAFVNNQQVSYTLSETCSTGGINWTWTGGTASGSFNQGLVAGELTAGAHGPSTIANNPALVSGAVYTITFSCTDLAGNVATAITRTGVTFDNTPPTISIQNLRNNGTVNTGFLIGPAADNVGVTMVDVSLDAGAYTAATGLTAWKFALPSGAATWPDRSVHTIVARATDAAGNTTTTTSITVRKGTNQDINGDGYSDLAAGAWKYTTSTGRAYVFYGGAAGLGASLTANATTTVITGEATNNNFSRTMAIGDFNGDGFGDLAVAGYGYSTNTGRVYIFNGGAAGITLSTAASANRIINGGAVNDQFGSLVIAGNANNDGYCDLIVAANGYSSSTGRAYVYHGSASGITGTTTAMANVTITGEASSQFGGSMVLGDFNGDSFSDLAVGAPFYNGTSNGRAYIFYGSGAGIPAGTAATATAVATGGAASDAFGGSMTAGDINGDGNTDLVVGAYGFTTNTGRASVFYGSAGAGIPLANSAVPGTTINGTNTGAFFTTSAYVSDLNGDGFGDLIVGAYGCTANPAGCTYVFYGLGGGLASGTASLAGYQATGTTSGDNFGRAVGATDINGDSFPDLLVGANLRNTSQGAGYVFLSSGSGPAINTAASANTVINGEPGAFEFAINVFR